MELQLKHGICFVDDEDWEKVKHLTWASVKSGNVFYAIAHTHRADGHRTTVKMHRLILDLTDPRVEVDHRDGNGLDNRRTNIRAATKSMNMRNAHHTKSISGVIGVFPSGSLKKPWRVMVNRNRRLIHYGRFATIEEARQKYESVRHL
jgi:hypothetical protein